MKVTVILPIYNGAQTLSKTLDSLCAQTFKDFEVVACIDGSNDDSETILESYREQFLKLNILKNKKNRGLGSTMNRLLSHANGLYIAVAEQDDYYVATRLEKQVAVLDADLNIGMVSGIANFVSGDTVLAQFPGFLVNKKQYPIGEEMFLLNYKQQIKVVNSCMMFKKQVHIDNGLYFTQHYPSISVDWTYVLRFSLVSEIHGIHDVLVEVDRSENRNSVTSNKEKQFKATRELLRSMMYEFPSVVTKPVYKYALRTQVLLEWGQAYGVRFYLLGVYYILLNFRDARFLNKMKRRIKSKLK
ncbi:glycosyltransferase family 2 protein [Lacinutrix undariae]